LSKVPHKFRLYSTDKKASISAKNAGFRVLKTFLCGTFQKMVSQGETAMPAIPAVYQ